MTAKTFMIMLGFLFSTMAWMMVSLKWNRFKERPSSCCGGICCAAHDHGNCGKKES